MFLQTNVLYKRTLTYMYPYILSVLAKNMIYGHVIKHVKLGCTLGLMYICTYLCFMVYFQMNLLSDDQSVVHKK